MCTVYAYSNNPTRVSQLTCMEKIFLSAKEGGGTLIPCETMWNEHELGQRIPSSALPANRFTYENI